MSGVGGSAAEAPSAAAETHNVFVYGSLMTDEAARLVLKRVPSSAAALLHGYHRFRLKGRHYPAIRPVEGGKVAGKVLLGLTNDELHILDIFEDVEYMRISVEISLTDTCEVLPAYAYVWANKDDPDLYGEWDFEEWKQLHMEDFLRMTQLTADFMEEIENPDLKYLEAIK